MSKIQSDGHQVRVHTMRLEQAYEHGGPTPTMKMQAAQVAACSMIAAAGGFFAACKQPELLDEAVADFKRRWADANGQGGTAQEHGGGPERRRAGESGEQRPKTVKVFRQGDQFR